jgi:uncharacterized membrane protein YhiD involved in acid resistance
MIPDWLQTANVGEGLAEWPVVAGRLGLALLGGLLTAGLYYLTLGRGRTDLRSLPTTLVLLCVLIAMVTVVIGNNIARAFGLVGALSIVRFRTVVEDTADTAFVIFSVAVGMAIGSGFWLLAMMAFPIVGLAAFIMLQLDRSRRWESMRTLIVKCAAGQNLEMQVAGWIEPFVTVTRLESAGTAGKGTALELVYRVRLRRADQLLPLIQTLSRQEGILAAEFK